MIENHGTGNRDLFMSSSYGYYLLIVSISKIVPLEKLSYNVSSHQNVHR